MHMIKHAIVVQVWYNAVQKDNAFHAEAATAIALHQSATFHPKREKLNLQAAPQNLGRS